MKKKTSMQVVESRTLAENIYSLTLSYDPSDRPEAVRPGQFVGLYPNDPSRLLPRPISICRYDPGRGELRLVYRAVGAGTGEFAELRGGDRIRMLGILGNGYDLNLLKSKKVLLLGGGIGIPPMLELAAALKEAGTEAEVCLGYRNQELFLKDEFDEVSRLYISTEDGSRGVRGTVLDAVREAGITPEAVCACGPLPMLRAVKAYAAERKISCYVSLEEHMACGVGACLGCVVKTTHKDPHSNVNNARICTEGPVFNAEDVDI